MSPRDDFVFHDRLTHSLKVAQVAKSLAQRLRKDYGKKVPSAGRRRALNALPLDADVCYVAGLIHDIGHPPFGHAAEVTLQELLEVPQSDGKPLLPDSFEGNAQSFRIVSRLSFRKANSGGLDLTWRTLAAISKYPWIYADARTTGEKQKWGFYDPESRFHDHLLKEGLIAPHGVGAEIRQSLEAQVMDWADDIAYAVHDLEDFYRTGRVPLERLRLVIPQREGWIDTPEWKSIVEAGTVKVRKHVKPADLSQAELDQLMLDIQDLFVQQAFDGSRAAHQDLQEMSSSLTSALSSECSVEQHPVSKKPYLHITPRGRATAEFLKTLTHRYVIQDPTTEMMQAGQKRVVRELFVALWEASQRHYAGGEDDETNALPARFQAYAREALTTQAAGRDDYEAYDGRYRKLARATVDFICGLTDKQAALLHQRLTGDSVAGLASYYLNV